MLSKFLIPKDISLWNFIINSSPESWTYFPLWLSTYRVYKFIHPLLIRIFIHKWMDTLATLAHRHTAIVSSVEYSDSSKREVNSHDHKLVTFDVHAHIYDALLKSHAYRFAHNFIEIWTIRVPINGYEIPAISGDRNFVVSIPHLEMIDSAEPIF